MVKMNVNRRNINGVIVIIITITYRGSTSRGKLAR